MNSRPAVGSEYIRPAGSAGCSMLCCSLPCGRREWRELRHNWKNFIAPLSVLLPRNVWIHVPYEPIRGPKRKPPCIGGMELVSLSCNRVFISAESVGRGWCKIAIATQWYQFHYGLGWYKYAIATQWYQFHTTDKCGFLFMPWIIDQYTFVRYTKLVNKIGTAVVKVIIFFNYDHLV